MKELKEMKACYKVLNTIEHHTIVYDFPYNERIDGQDLELIKNMDRDTFEDYFYNEMLDISCIDYEENMIWDCIEDAMNLLEYESTEDFENFDAVYDFFKTSIIFEYNLDNLLKNSNIQLKKVLTI